MGEHDLPTHYALILCSEYTKLTFLYNWTFSVINCQTLETGHSYMITKWDKVLALR
jgi:hypothetical protein